jgi:hypothetical protein
MGFFLVSGRDLADVGIICVRPRNGRRIARLSEVTEDFFAFLSILAVPAKSTQTLRINPDSCQVPLDRIGLPFAERQYLVEDVEALGEIV